MVLIKLENDDIDIFKKIITENDVCPDLIICYFTATWCGPCKQISPIVSNIAENNEHIRVLKIDVDDCEDISEFCKIDCMTTFKFYKNNYPLIYKYKKILNNNLKKLYYYFIIIWC